MSNSNHLLFVIRRLFVFLLGCSMPFNQVKWHIGSASFTVSVFCMLAYFLVMLPSYPYFFQLKTIYSKKIFLPLYFFAVLIFSNLFYFDNIYGVPIVNTSLFWCIILYYFLLLHQVLDSKSLNIALSGFAIGSIAIAICFILGYEVSIDSGGRFVVFAENANTIGIFQSIGAVVILNEFIINDFFKLKIFRFGWLLAFIPMIALLLACGSRTAFLIFFFTLIGTVYFFPTKKRILKYLIILVGSCFVIYAVSKLIQSDSILAERLLTSVEEHDTNGRTDISKQLLPAFWDHPILGVGQTGYVDVSKKYTGNYLEDDGAVVGISPHNVFIEVLMYTGIIGFIIMCTFWFWSFKSAWRKYKITNNLSSFLLVIPVLACLLSAQLLTIKWGYLLYAYFLFPQEKYCKKQN